MGLGRAAAGIALLSRSASIARRAIICLSGDTVVMRGVEREVAKVAEHRVREMNARIAAATAEEETP